MSWTENVLWLFPAYREVVMQRDQLLRVVEDLERHIASRPADATDLVRKYQDEILVEQPFPGGKIPDTLWLTPPDDRE